MSRFKVGDKLKVGTVTSGNGVNCSVFDKHNKGRVEYLILTSGPDSYGSIKYDAFDKNNRKIDCCGCFLESEVEYYSSSNVNMNALSRFKNLFRGEPEKSFIKAGLMDDNAQLNSDGKTIFNEWLFNKYKEEFNTEVVQPILKAVDEETKKD